LSIDPKIRQKDPSKSLKENYILKAEKKKIEEELKKKIEEFNLERKSLNRNILELREQIKVLKNKVNSLVR
jgi:chaperonin cofactor prefoldin